MQMMEEMIEEKMEEITKQTPPSLQERISIIREKFLSKIGKSIEIDEEGVAADWAVAFSHFEQGVYHSLLFGLHSKKEYK